MNFCSNCGARVQRTIPPGDDRPRAVCPSCNAIHYVNPKTVVGCLVEHEEQLLICRRAIEPAKGLWTLPAGFLEIEESAAEGAARETREEANARVEIVAPHSYLDLPHIGQSYFLFRARLVVPEFSAGEESLEVRLSTLDEIPWDDLAFPVIRMALELYREDLRSGQRPMHFGVARWSGEGNPYHYAEYELADHVVS